MAVRVRPAVLAQTLRDPRPSIPRAHGAAIGGPVPRLPTAADMPTGPDGDAHAEASPVGSRVHPRSLRHDAKRTSGIREGARPQTRFARPARARASFSCAFSAASVRWEPPDGRASPTVTHVRVERGTAIWLRTDARVHRRHDARRRDIASRPTFSTRGIGPTDSTFGQMGMSHSCVVPVERRSSASAAGAPASRRAPRTRAPISQSVRNRSVTLSKPSGPAPSAGALLAVPRPGSRKVFPASGPRREPLAPADGIVPQTTAVEKRNSSSS